MDACAQSVKKLAAKEAGLFEMALLSFLLEKAFLFDTPEDVDKSLEREGIHEVHHLVYTHWHPDHTAGRRVLEQLNMETG